MTTLSEFVHWTRQHIKGDEKGEAQVFLDRFFRAFDWEGAKEAGAEYEERIRKATVRTAYGMKKTDDVLEFLLALNRACAAREANDGAITPPG